MLKKKKEVPIITSLRMLPSLKAELKKAAHADERNFTSLVTKILKDWLRKQNDWK